MKSFDTNVAVRLLVEDDPAQAGPADFSDYFIRESSREASALPVLTFDERFARGTDVELVPET